MSCGVACAWCVQHRNRCSAAVNPGPGGGMGRRGARPATRELQCCACVVCATVQPDAACAGQRGRWCRQRGRCIALLTSAKRHRHSRTSTSLHWVNHTSLPQRQAVISLHRRTSLSLPQSAAVSGGDQSANGQTYQAAAPMPLPVCPASTEYRSAQRHHVPVCRA